MSITEPVTTPAVRPFTPVDAAPVHRLLARAWPHDDVSERWFLRAVMLDPAFDPEGLLIAADATGIVGVARVVVQDAPGGRTAWLPFLAVDPAARRRGIGGRLLATALDRARVAGARRVDVASYAPGYLIPGIDLDHAPEAIPLFERFGFRTIEEPVGMRRRLDIAPASPSDAERAATADGFVFRACAAGDVPDLLAFAAAVGDDWGDVLRAAIAATGDPGRIQLALSPEGAVVGFAAFGSYEDVQTRFGPFGVDPAMRGRSLGRILLDRTLAAMAGRGLPEAWFLWTEPDGPAGRLYRRTGFVPDRRFRIMRLELDTPAPAPATDTEERQQ